MFFLGCTSCHDNFVELMVNLEHEFPRKWSSVTLETFGKLAYEATDACIVPFHTSTIVGFFDFDSVQPDTCVDCVQLIILGSSGKTHALLVQQTNHVLTVYTPSGLPADMKCTAQLYLAQ